MVAFVDELEGLVGKIGQGEEFGYAFLDYLSLASLQVGNVGLVDQEGHHRGHYFEGVGFIVEMFGDQVDQPEQG